MFKNEMYDKVTVKELMTNPPQHFSNSDNGNCNEKI